MTFATAPTRRRARIACGAALAAALGPLPLAAQLAPHAGSEAYTRLATRRFAAAQAIPAGGVALRRDVAEWRLEDGQVRLQEPLGSGEVTGALFTGRGTMRMAVPDPVEQAQVTRLLSGPGAALELAFDRLVLRAPGGVDRLLGLTATCPCSAAAEVEQRDRHWRLALHDLDARVVEGLVSGGDWLWVEVRTAEHGWLAFELEPRRGEELALQRFRDGFLERLVALDRAEDRRADGRPAADRREGPRLRHVAIRADLRLAGRGPRRGLAEIHPRRGRFVAELDFALPAGDPPRTLALVLHPEAVVSRVGDGDGGELPFLRGAIGERDVTIDARLQDDDLLVLLPSAAAAVDTRRVTVEYELEILNYVEGRGWYPQVAESEFTDRHTGELELLVPGKLEVRAMGRQEAGEEVGDDRRLRFVVDQPTAMLTFVLAERGMEQEVRLEGAPVARVFANRPGSTARNKLHNVGADVVNSVAWFQQLFDMPLAADSLTVTSIVGHHGQAFEGFLHLAEGTFESAHPGASELFHAHEVAHQWWGHRLPWASYRDQWLSEAFAEYSAMLFVGASMGEDGRRYFDEILEAYLHALTGSLQGAMGRFARPGLLPLNDHQRARVGPMAVGWRAATAEAPGGYFAQAYHRGAWVLHMLRVLLRNQTKSDDAFFTVLRTFLAEHDGRPASSADFVAALQRVAPGDWSWFFTQWVEGTAVPTYRWRWQATEQGGKPAIELEVRQEGVPVGFRMPVPLAVELSGGRRGQVVVLVDEAAETFTVPVPERPREVQLNPGHAVLAHVERLR